MSEPKHWILGGWYPRGLIAHQQWYLLGDSNTNLDLIISNLYDVPINCRNVELWLYTVGMATQSIYCMYTPTGTVCLP